MNGSGGGDHGGWIKSNSGMNGWTDKKHKVSGVTTQSRCEKVSIFSMTDFSVIKHLLREAKKGSNFAGNLHNCLFLVVSTTLWISINTRTRSMRTKIVTHLNVHYPIKPFQTDNKSCLHIHHYIKFHSECFRTNKHINVMMILFRVLSMLEKGLIWAFCELLKVLFRI